MKTLINKILNYEECIFNEYSSKRKILIKNIKNVSFLDKPELINFINDIKAVIDPIKTSTSAIDHYLTNIDFKNNESSKNVSELLFIYLLFGLISTETLETELPESSESSESSESESESELSESNSSRSVSVTFSNIN